jgi:nucleoside-diphosphate-sugar epimerase
MKLVIIGASGTIGRAIVAELAPRHQIVQVGKTKGDHQVDITDSRDVAALFDKLGKVDAIELPRGLRINAVSPTVLQESIDQFGPYFRGFEAVPARRVALAYSKSVEGAQTGQVYKVW